METPTCFFGERRWENEELIKVSPEKDLSIIKFKNPNHVELSVLRPKRFGNKILYTNSEICLFRTILIFFIKCKKSTRIKKFLVKESSFL